MMARILGGSRYIVLIAVIGCLLASAIVTVFAGVELVRLLLDFIRAGPQADDLGKSVAVGAAELIELFLLGTVLYVIALGLYQLFIDRNILLPKWLTIHSLDNLKERLLGTVVVMLAVSFLGFVVTWDGSMNILGLGAAVGLVLASLGYIMSLGRRQHGASHGSPSTGRPTDSASE
jgi:uncharacterized membrane protein YqhA